MYSAQREKILNSLDLSHDRFYSSEIFGGPSLYFHHRALAAAQTGLLPNFAETSYAMLASWGMHRMGKGGAKMADFKIYETSLIQAWPTIQELTEVLPEDATELHWVALKEVFLLIKAMQSSFSLVATSKVLAHVLPNLVPPVDRHYTIRFLYRNRVLPKNIEGEWELLREFLESFFHPILKEPRFTTAAAKWNVTNQSYPWDTSLLKTVDNVLVGYMRRDDTNPR